MNKYSSMLKWYFGPRWSPVSQKQAGGTNTK